VLNATALVAAIGDGHAFSRGRDLSAWLGLVPRQATTGGKPKLLGITKRGSRYLRKLIIQGARAALPSLARSATPLGSWLRGLLSRAHGNTVVVALASKLARIAWALLRKTQAEKPARGGRSLSNTAAGAPHRPFSPPSVSSLPFAIGYESGP
jgi:transposase